MNKFKKLSSKFNKIDKSVIFAFVSVSAWGTLSTVTKLLVASMSNMFVIFISSSISAAGLFIFDIFGKKMKLFKKYSLKQYFIMAFLGFIGIFLYSVLYYYGLKVLTAQTACVINYLWPILIVLFSIPILKEKVTIKKLLAIICSFVGVIVLAFGENSGADTFAGILCCLGAAVCYALFSVLNKRFSFRQEVLMPIVWLVCAICSCVYCIVFKEFSIPNAVEWAELAYIGLIVNALAYLFWGLALNTTSNTALVSNLAYLAPLISVFLSAIILKEQIKLTSIIALILIVGGVLMQSLKINIIRRTNYE